MLSYEEYLQKEIEEGKFDFDDKYDLAIDLGSNKGIVSKHLLNFFNKVIAVEADPSFKDYYKDTNIIFENSAIVEDFYEDSSITFYSTGKDNGSIFQVENSKPITVKALKVKDFVNKYNLKEVDFLKVDIEGSEVTVLPNLLAYIGVKDLFIETTNLDFFFHLIKNFNFKILKFYSYPNLSFKKRTNFLGFHIYEAYLTKR